MIQTLPQQTFQAHWEKSFEPKKEILSDKVKKVFWNILSVLIPLIALYRLFEYALGRLAARIILPASSFGKDRVDGSRKAFMNYWFKEPLDEILDPMQRELRETFEPSLHTLRTPDGVNLSATFFRHKDATEDTPTILFFQPNATTYFDDIYRWLQVKAIDEGKVINFALFDYRSVGDSTGSFNTTKDLLVDGATAVQWLKEAMEIPQDKIFFYGTSLGGAVSVDTAALDSQNNTGAIVNVRSLSSLEDFISSFGLPRWIKGVLKRQELVLNPANSIHSLQGDKLIAFDPNDEIMQDFVSLNTHCQRTLDYTRVKLASLNPNLYGYHNAPLSACWDDERDQAGDTSIANFIFQRV